MENSPEEQRREETYHLYSPCYLCEQVVKAFLKCLGHESHDSTPEQATNSPSEAERETKITQEEFKVQSTRFIRAMPPRPPISSGRGGQINYASS